MSATVDVRDPVQVHEAVVADRLLDLRDQFYVLTVNYDYVRENRRTGEKISPAHDCICPNCSEKTEVILFGVVDDNPQYFCFVCFDEAWRPWVEEKLAAGGDY
jgi:hypothetical protein